jgi:hypothetical protein
MLIVLQNVHLFVAIRITWVWNSEFPAMGRTQINGEKYSFILKTE